MTPPMTVYKIVPVFGAVTPRGIIAAFAIPMLRTIIRPVDKIATAIGGESPIPTIAVNALAVAPALWNALRIVGESGAEVQPLIIAIDALGAIAGKLPVMPIAMEIWAVP